MEQKLSRFELHADTLHLDSEKVLFTVPDDREVMWHVSGGLAFDSKGNLFVSLGDNTNPFESQGYSPIDEGVLDANDPTSKNRHLYDAQRTAANSNDLRGKILRITPTSDGKYTSPTGNLWTADKGRVALHQDSIAGALVGTKADIPVTGDWQTWQDVTVPVTDPGGTHKYCFVFERSPGDKLLFNLNYIYFTGAGVRVLRLCRRLTMLAPGRW